MEDLDTVEDDNCNGNVGMMRPFVNTVFNPPMWSLSGSVAVLPPSEGLVIPSSGGWATRSPGVSFSTEQVVAVDVDWVAGPDCQLGISVTVGGVGHS